MSDNTALPPCEALLTFNQKSPEIIFTENYSFHTLGLENKSLFRFWKGYNLCGWIEKLIQAFQRSQKNHNILRAQFTF
jgi:hypothetical protein